MRRLSYLFIILSAFIGFIAFASMVYGFISILSTFDIELGYILFLTFSLLLDLFFIKSIYIKKLHQDTIVCDQLNKDMYQIKANIKKWEQGELNTYDCMFAVLKVLQEEVQS